MAEDFEETVVGDEVVRRVRDSVASAFRVDGAFLHIVGWDVR